MKVYILTEGGRGIGFGHITRCFSLYQAFAEKGVEAKFIVTGDTTINKLLEGARYRVFDWLNEKNGLSNMLHDADMAIADSYLADLSTYNTISEKVEIPVYIDDYKRMAYPHGFVVNGSVYAEDLDYPKSEKVTYLLGPKYALLRRAFWDAPEKTKRQKVKNIMITFGGHDRRNMTFAILKFLKEQHPDVIKKVIVSSGFQNREEIEKLRGENVDLIYAPDENRLKEIMVDCDLAVSSGGQTTYELARTGTPAVGISVADNQKRNLEKWQENGFIEFIGGYDDENLLEKLEKSLRLLFSYGERAKRAKNAKGLIDGMGAIRLAVSLLKYSAVSAGKGQRGISNG